MDNGIRVGLINQAEKVLLKHRWLVMAILGLISIVIELIEHVMEAGPLLTPEFFIEIFIHGIALPVIGGVLLGFLERTETERDTALDELSLIDALLYRFNNSHSWEELAEAIVEFPRTIMPLDGVCLWVIDHQTNEFEYARSRGVAASALTAVSLASYGKHDLACIQGEAEKPYCFMDCTCPAGIKRGRENLRQYCLPLFNTGVAVGMLHLYPPAGIVIEKEAKSLLLSLAPEISLAIDNLRAERLADNQEKSHYSEKRQIVHNLHDTLGQDLVVIRQTLDKIAQDQDMQKLYPLMVDLQNMSQVANQAYEQVRSMLIFLNSDSSDHSPDSLSEYACAVGKRASFEVKYTSYGDPLPLPTQVQFQVFSIFREIFANIEKHAHAQLVEVIVTWTDTDMMIEVTDDGCGFNLDGYDPSQHFGINIMRERASQIQGRIEVVTTRDSGTKVAFIMPLPRSVNEANLLQEDIIPI